MLETVLITFISMLADVVVTIPMIIAGAFLPRKYMLILAAAGAVLLTIAMGGGSSGDMFVVKLVGRLMAMTFAGFMGNVIYLKRMAKKVRLAGTKA